MSIADTLWPDRTGKTALNQAECSCRGLNSPHGTSADAKTTPIAPVASTWTWPCTKAQQCTCWTCPETTIPCFVHFALAHESLKMRPGGAEMAPVNGVQAVHPLTDAVTSDAATSLHEQRLRRNFEFTLSIGPSFCRLSGEVHASWGLPIPTRLLGKLQGLRVSHSLLLRRWAKLSRYTG